MTLEDTAPIGPDGFPTVPGSEPEIDLQQEPTDRDYERRWWTLGVCASASS